MKGLSFLSIVRFRDRFPKRSVERLELVRGEYQDCGRKRKNLLRTRVLALMDGYSQSGHALVKSAGVFEITGQKSGSSPRRERRRGEERPYLAETDFTT
jgi:hypothetical protein